MSQANQKSIPDHRRQPVERSDTGDYLGLVVKDFQVAPLVLHKRNYVGKDLVGVAGIVADAADSQGKPLPKVLVIHLGHRHVELVPNAAGQRTGYLPLAL
jgi:hypothetical protein